MRHTIFLLDSERHEVPSESPYYSQGGSAVSPKLRGRPFFHVPPEKEGETFWWDRECIIRKVVAGTMTTEQFLSLYTAAQSALRQFILAHIPDLHEAEDVMQEVAVLLWKKFPEFEPGTSFPKWAIRVAQYEILHARRAHARRRIVLTPKLSDRAAERYETMDFAQVETERRALEL